MSATPNRRALSGQLHLRILATSDLHANLMPFDYHADTPADNLGLVRTASLIRQARSEVVNTLLLDNGDVLQGTALGDLVAERVGTANPMPHPIISAMNTLGYDAGTVGNHEFSYGFPVMDTLLSQASFPIVSANMLRRRGHVPGSDAFLFSPFVNLQRAFANNRGQPQLLRVGIIGVCPPQVLTWDHPHVAGRLQVRDMVQAATAAASRARKAGADIIILLAHTGLGTLPAVTGQENAGLALAGIPMVDAIVLGHAHQVFPSPTFAALPDVDLAVGHIRGKPAVMPGMFGSHLGIIDLTLARRHGRWRVQAGHAHVRAISARDAHGRATALAADDPELRALAAPSHRHVKMWMQRPIGHSTHPLHTYFALVSDSAALGVVAQAQTAQVQSLLKTTAFATLPIVSSAAPFKAGGRAGPDNYTDIAAGPLCVRHASDLYIHPNTFSALLVTGADIVEWLERSATIFHRIMPGSRDAQLIDPDIPAFNMEMLSGVTYTIDLASPPRYDSKGFLCNPAARRILDLKYQGNPVTAAMQFVLATNSYRTWVYAAQAANPVQVLVESHTPMREILVDYITRFAEIPAPPPVSWRLQPMPGTTVTLDTAPRAIDHLADIAHLRPLPLGLTALGFQRFRLSL